MDKKIYITPLILNLEYEDSLMDSTSLYLDSEQSEPTVVPDPEEIIDGGFGSRRNDLWSDDE